MKPRHELKHEISYTDYLVLSSRLKAVMQKDSHAGSSGEYFIRSLYFDTPENRALREKLDGVNMREKFRLRCYNFDFGLIKLEKKCKINGLCTKQSVMISEQTARDIIEGRIDTLKKSDGLLLELYSKMKCGLSAKTVVDYVREPYVYPAGNVRVTIDRCIRTGLSSVDFFDLLLPTVAAGRGEIILEVKYDEFLPDIIRDTVQLPARKAGAFSKYAACRIYG